MAATHPVTVSPQAHLTTGTGMLGGPGPVARLALCCCRVGTSVGLDLPGALPDPFYSILRWFEAIRSLMEEILANYKRWFGLELSNCARHLKHAA